MTVHRIALFSDVHGNASALDAVLAQIDAQDVNSVYCLGDLVGYGPDPTGVIQRIREREIPTIMGNYDEGIGLRRGGCGCYYATDEARADGHESYEFTNSVLDEADHRWLASLPKALKLEIESIRVVLAHGSPRKNNEYLLPDRTEEQLIRLAENAEADVVCVGHVHVPYHRSMSTAAGSTVHYASCGSVGKPKDGDPRAGWIELLIGDESEIRTLVPDDAAVAPAGAPGITSVGVRFHRTEYDVESVITAMAVSYTHLTLPTTPYV